MNCTLDPSAEEVEYRKEKAKRHKMDPRRDPIGRRKILQKNFANKNLSNQSKFIKTNKKSKEVRFSNVMHNEADNAPNEHNADTWNKDDDTSGSDSADDMSSDESTDD